MEGFVDVRLYLQDFKGKRTVNGEAIIEIPGRVKKANDNRYGDIIITADKIIDFDTLVGLAEEANRIDEIDSREGITFYHVPCEFNRIKYKTKEGYGYGVKAHLGNDDFYANRYFFANAKQEHRLKKNNMLSMFTDVVDEEAELPGDLDLSENTNEE